VDPTVHRNYSRSIPKEWRDIAKVFVAMGDAHRQRILLTFDRGERLNVGQIADVSTLSRSAVSHHLKVMREAGVLGSEKIGKEVWFWVEGEALLGALASVSLYIRDHA
jgi:DNA-binding transcriptional ArsR family regulator